MPETLGDAPTTSAISLGEADDLRRFCAEVVPTPSPFEATMINEAVFGLSRLAGVLPTIASPPRRVLEVGAGHMILSAYLASRGFHVTAVEPLTNGFDTFASLHARMVGRAAALGAPLTVRQCAIDEIDAREAFDVVICVNALEHMADPLGALDVMHAAVRRGGVVLVHCPNYDVPFDSHFGIILVTLNKRLNAWLYRDRIARLPEVWDGLTFVRQSVLRRHCAAQGYTVTFNRRMLAQAVGRLQDDPVFAARMPRPLRTVAGLLVHPAVAWVLRRVPLRWQTPMECVLRKPAASLSVGCGAPGQN